MCRWLGGVGALIVVWVDRWCILDLWLLCDVGSLGVLLVCKHACWLLLLNCLNLCGFACYYFCAGILHLVLVAAFGVTLLRFWV